MSAIDRFDFSVCSDRSTLILSDAYPPYADGGAELSLKACLDQLSEDARGKAVVISFSPRIDDFAISDQEGLLVVHAPNAVGWPDHDLFIEELRQKRTRRLLGDRNYGRLRRFQRFLFSPNRAAAMQIYKEARTFPRGGILTDFILDSQDVRYRFVERVAKAMAANEILLADNTRSILLGAEMLKGGITFKETSAVVRDNRFHCARPTQSRIVNEKICQKCSFQCAREDVAPRNIPTRQKSLQLTQDKRKTALNMYDKVVVTSHELARHVGPILNEVERLIRIPNTVESVEKVSVYTADIQPSGYSDIVVIGMLNENKGQLQFIQNCAAWIKANDDVNIIFCGRGERLQEAIETIAAEEGISKQIRFEGYLSRDAIYQAISRHTLVLAPTVWPEPFGRVPLEAGMAGKPVVAFGVGGLNENIIDGVTGRLVRPGEYRALEAALDDLLNDPAKRRKMGEAAQTWVSERYGPEQTTQRFVKVCFGIDAKSSGKPGSHAASTAFEKGSSVA